MEVANKLPSASNEDMLELYGWFKQANVGDVNTGASVPREPARFHRVRIATPRSTTDPCGVRTVVSAITKTCDCFAVTFEYVID